MHSSRNRMSSTPLQLAGMMILALVLALILRTIQVLYQIQRKRSSHSQESSPRTHPIKTVAVLGSGGHTTEMLSLISGLSESHYTPLTFVVATTDTTSLRRVEAASRVVRKPDAICRIPRSREVGQSYVSSVATTLWSFVHAVGLVFKLRPGLLLCNGPGTCLPIAIMTLVARILGLCEGQIVFVESFCRVTSLSLTGKLLYPLVDLFVVHWEQLQDKYPNTQLVTTFVRRSGQAGQSTS